MTPPLFARMSGTTKTPRLVQMPVGLRCRRAVGPFHDDPGADARRVVHGDLGLERGWNQHVDVELKELFGGHGLRRRGTQ